MDLAALASTAALGVLTWLFIAGCSRLGGPR